MKVLVVEGNVYILVSGRLSGVSIVNLGSRQVRVSNVKRPANHERLSCIPFGVLRVPGLQNLQGIGVYLRDDYIPCILVGCVHDPHSQFVGHDVDVRVSAPCVRVHVVEAGELQRSLGMHGACLKAVLDDYVALVLVVVKRPVVDDMVGSLPFKREAVGPRNHSCHKVFCRLELTYNFAVGVAVHIPNLHHREGRKLIVRSDNHALRVNDLEVDLLEFLNVFSPLPTSYDGPALTGNVDDLYRVLRSSDGYQDFSGRSKSARSKATNQQGTRKAFYAFREGPRTQEMFHLFFVNT